MKQGDMSDEQLDKALSDVQKELDTKLAKLTKLKAGGGKVSTCGATLRTDI
jgi:hypothetical protein